MNKAIFIGNICRDIELKMTPEGKAVTTNCVAVRREYKNANGEYESDFINIVAWGAQAEYLNKYARKGDTVGLVGRWQTRKYTNSYGTQQTANECVVESIAALGKPPKEEQPHFEEIPENNDLPF